MPTPSSAGLGEGDQAAVTSLGGSLAAAGDNTPAAHVEDLSDSSPFVLLLVQVPVRPRTRLQDGIRKAKKIQ